MIRSILLSSIFVIILLTVSCGENPLNTELDPSGTYHMTVEYFDSDLFCTLTLVKNENGFLNAAWDYGSRDGSTHENTAVCFGENYLAIYEPGDPPVLMSLDNPGTCTLDGDNPDGSSYVGYQSLEAFGKVIACDQTITPNYEPDEYYRGVGVIIDEHLVMAVSSFLSVYTRSGNDWRGVLSEYSLDEVTDENLSYTGS